MSFRVTMVIKTCRIVLMCVSLVNESYESQKSHLAEDIDSK